MSEVNARIDELMGETMARIADAAAKQNLTELEAQTRRASELKQMKDQLAAIQQRLMALGERAAAKNDEDEHPHLGNREVMVEVSQGMINQNLLTLTDPMKRGQIRAGEEMVVETLPSGERFKSTVLQSGNKLQERGAVGRFYRRAGVRAGDYIVMREVSRGQWQLLKRTDGAGPHAAIERGSGIVRRIFGAVEIEPTIDGGVIRFALKRDGGELIACASHPYFVGGVPRRGVRLTLVGEEKVDPDSTKHPVFVFTGVES